MQFQKMECCTYFKIKNSWVYMFWTFNLSFVILATVLATFPNIGRFFSQFSGHSEYNDEKISTRFCREVGYGRFVEQKAHA